MCTIQVHPSWKLQVDWICSGLAGGEWVPCAEGAMSLLHMISHGPGRAELHSTPASFAWHIEHNCTLDRSVRSACTRPSPVRHNWHRWGHASPLAVTSVSNSLAVSLTSEKLLPIKESITGVVYTGEEFLTGVNDTGNACISGVVDTGEAQNYQITVRIFEKKSKSLIGTYIG